MQTVQSGRKHFPVVSFFVFMFFVYGESTELPGYRVVGRYLYDRCGEKVVLRGVNKMELWAGGTGNNYPEIAKTGANCVRIVWGTSGSVSKFDNVIAKCLENKMIPMMELHDATGNWSKLSSMVDWWVRSDVVNVVRKYEKDLLVNIANECGDASVTPSQWVSGYAAGIKRMRGAGINACLVVDATDWGKNIDVIISSGQELLALDPHKNILFSAHAYWPFAWGWSEQKVKDRLQAAADRNLAFIIGEFGNKWDETPSGEIPYKTITAECRRLEVGWLAWSWDPGNDPQKWLDMTSNNTFAGLKGWGLEVAVTDPNSIKNTSVRPYSILHGKCDENPVKHTLHGDEYNNFTIFPGSNGAFTVHTSRGIAGTFELLDMTGKCVAKSGPAVFNPGIHKLTFGSAKLSSGAYFIRLVTSDSRVINGVRVMIVFR